MNLFIAIVAFVVLIYGFNAVKRSASPKVKQIGLSVWLGLGMVALGYLIIYGDRGDAGIIILSAMVALFWILPTGALLYLSRKSIRQ